MPRSNRKKQQGYGQHVCTVCNVLFATHQKLMKLKAEKRDKDPKDHIHCKFCGQDFQTLDGERYHLRNKHPQEQVLQCPGCGHGPFGRVSGLMAHIESGECIRITASQVEDARIEKLKAVDDLKKLTKGPVEGSFSNLYMPASTKVPTVVGAWVARDPDLTSSEPPKCPENDENDIADFPSLPKPKGDATPPVAADVRQKENIRPRESSDVEKKPLEKESKEASLLSDFGSQRPTARCWFEQKLFEEQNKPAPCTVKKDLFPDAAPPQKPSPQQTAALSKPNARQQYESQDIDHPSHPDFDVSKYLCPYSEAWICPKRCVKSFKTKWALIGHLKGPAHGDVVYACPACNRKFKSLTSMTAHCESNSTKCHMRHTKDYGAYLDQLTGGIINVDAALHDDGTPMYHTSKSAHETYGGTRKSEKQAVPIPAPGDDSYW